MPNKIINKYVFIFKINISHLHVTINCNKYNVVLKQKKMIVENVPNWNRTNTGDIHYDETLIGNAWAHEFPINVITGGMWTQEYNIDKMKKLVISSIDSFLEQFPLDTPMRVKLKETWIKYKLSI